MTQENEIEILKRLNEENNKVLMAALEACESRTSECERQLANYKIAIGRVLSKEDKKRIDHVLDQLSEDKQWR